MMEPRLRVGAICRRNDNLLLVEHQREKQRYWLLPGGGVEEGELAAEALVREVSEETGFEIKPKRLVCVCESISPDGARHIIHFIYETVYVSGRLSFSRDPRVINSAFVPIGTLGELRLRPPLQKWLQERLRGGFLDELEYLGALWVDEEPQQEKEYPA